MYGYITIMFNQNKQTAKLFHSISVSYLHCCQDHFVDNNILKNEKNTNSSANTFLSFITVFSKQYSYIVELES